jgi:hypothetical protein
MGGRARPPGAPAFGSTMTKTKQDEGWKEICISSGDHLKRTVEMVEELGFEIRLQELSPDELEGCSVCYGENEKVYRLLARPAIT